MDNKNFDNYNNSKLIKTILNILSSVSKKAGPSSDLDESYDESTYPQVQYLLPVEYEQNQTISDPTGHNQTDLQNTLMSQLSTPFIYICFMLIIYGIIVVIVLVSAVYSHRKKTGYNYEENTSECSDDSDSSDEISSLANSSSVKYSKLQTENDQYYRQAGPKTKRPADEATNEEEEVVTIIETNFDELEKSKSKKFKTSRMKRIKNNLKSRNFMHMKTQQRLAKYFSIRYSFNNQLHDSIKKPINYFKNFIHKPTHKNYATRYKTVDELVKIESLIGLDDIKNSNEHLDINKKSCDIILINS